MLLAAVARVVMDGAQGNLEQQLVRPQTSCSPSRRRRRARHAPADTRAAERPGAAGGIDGLDAFNGLGGFCRRRPRVRHPRRAATTTRCLQPRGRTSSRSRRSDSSASELGLGFTWSGEQPRQPPDAVAERSGPRPAGRSALHSRRRDRPALVGDAAAGGWRPPYTVRHGAGIHDLRARARRHRVGADAVRRARRAGQAVHADAPQHLRPRRQLSVTLYVEWVLGEDRSRTQPHIVTDREPATGALVAATTRSATRSRDRVAFVDLHPGDRADHRRPHRVHRPERFAALAGGARPATALSGRVGAALDPCGAVQVTVDARRRRARRSSSGSSVKRATCRCPRAWSNDSARTVPPKTPPCSRRAHSGAT